MTQKDKSLDDILDWHIEMMVSASWLSITEGQNAEVEISQRIVDEHRAKAKQAIKELIDRECNKARINSLLDLEQWAKLHDLDKEMILDGIEHMVISNLQVPDQPRLDHSERITELTKGIKDKGAEL